MKKVKVVRTGRSYTASHLRTRLSSSQGIKRFDKTLYILLISLYQASRRSKAVYNKSELFYICVADVMVVLILPPLPMT